ncbi:response regulator transcription factor [Flavobacterium sp. 7A]|uniref:response regulator n=1 Tax=Flavobacterium sp. 7A TaxID=2940571 RepID=UPI002226144F|nr:response regulator transcription factor [Flavobacterium sp. 7A]MCW2118332.1 DNA-binding NarL/FixJ family response regulator [Flavobacterium sp. 7A]
MTIEPVSNKIHKNILIVDDHPFIIQGYKNAITRYQPDDYDFFISEAKDCESGYNAIVDPHADFDIAFLDISMPSYESMNLYSGEDLAKLILKHSPDCKIIMLTMFTEFLKLKTMINGVNPMGLIIKNDLTFDELLHAFDKVIKGKMYYSKSILEMLESHDNAIEIDLFDKQILFHLSKGTKLKNIPQFIPISLNAIESRIINLKKILNVVDKKDNELVKEAKSKGLIF